MYTNVSILAESLNDGVEEEFEDEDFDLNTDYLAIISKVRSIVAFFSRSGITSDILAKHANEIGLKAVKLVTDVKTRWSSLSEMLKSFIKMIPAIKSTFEELDKPFEFDNEELDKLNVILEKILKKIN